MVVTKQMSVSAAQAFDAITKSLAYDYEQSTGKPIDPSDIKVGLTYVKNLQTRVKTRGDVEIKITALETNKCYESSVRSSLGTNITRYTLSDSDAGVLFEYEEEFLSDSKFKQMNFKLMSKVYAKSNRKRMNHLLDAIELSITGKEA